MYRMISVSLLILVTAFLFAGTFLQDNTNSILDHASSVKLTADGFGNVSADVYLNILGLQLNLDTTTSGKFEIGLGYKGLVVNPYIIFENYNYVETEKYLSESTAVNLSSYNKTEFVNISDSAPLTWYSSDWLGLTFGANALGIPVEFSYIHGKGDKVNPIKNSISVGAVTYNGLLSPTVNNVFDTVTTTLAPATDLKSEIVKESHYEPSHSFNYISVKVIPNFNFGNNTAYVYARYGMVYEAEKYRYWEKIEDTKKSTETDWFTANYSYMKNEITLKPAVESNLNDLLYWLAMEVNYSFYGDSAELVNEATKVYMEKPVFKAFEHSGNELKVDFIVYLEKEIWKDVYGSVEFTVRAWDSSYEKLTYWEYKDFPTGITGVDVTPGWYTTLSNATDTKVIGYETDEYSKNNGASLGFRLWSLKYNLKWDATDDLTVGAELNQAFLDEVLTGKIIPYFFYMIWGSRGDNSVTVGWPNRPFWNVWLEWKF